MKLSKKVISEIVYRVITKINESYYEYFEIYKEKIVSYIKQFGKKGKLDSYNGDLWVQVNIISLFFIILSLVSF